MTQPQETTAPETQPETTATTQPVTDDATQPPTTDDIAEILPPPAANGNEEVTVIINEDTGNVLVASDDGYMWFEFDEMGVPLGAWVWDDVEELWLFDEAVPLGAFPPFPVTVVQGNVLPQTGLANNSIIFASLIGFFAIVTTGAVALIKKEPLKRR